jgi:hypothetical protein
MPREGGHARASIFWGTRLLARQSHFEEPARAAAPLLRAAVHFLLGLTLLLNPLLLRAQNQANTEYHSKANYISKFPSFVDWPGEAFASGPAPFLICVLGDYPFGISLSELTAGQTFRNHRDEVRWIHSPVESRSCQLLFVSKSERKRYSQLFDAVRDQMILTVGETPDFLDAGGVIAFSMPGETIQFDVNLPAATKAHLKIGSQLLALARHVVRSIEAARN